MTVEQLITELSNIKNKQANVYIRIGGLPLVDVTSVEIDSLNDVILFEDNSFFNHPNNIIEMKKEKLTTAQTFIIDTLLTDVESKLIRDDFINRTYHIVKGNGITTKVRESTVSSLVGKGLLACNKAANRSLKYYYTIPNRFKRYNNS